jgi:hypothetical protein
MGRLTKPSRMRKSFFRPGTQAMVYGLIVLALLVFVDQLSMHYGLRESQRVVDDACGAAIAGVLVYSYERSRSKYLGERLKTIELMNHHVRNALQLISDSVYIHGHVQQMSEIQNAIKRIEWALQEVLPGRALNEKAETKKAAKHHFGGRNHQYKAR